ncbi:MAG: dihydropteroate synthase [Mariniblastus sp.]|jgi:dihydropteroate synthase
MTSMPTPANHWKLRSTQLTFEGLPAIMGIVNVTPDSFSDGGAYTNVELAVEHALKLAADGASILDVGGESTRPYSDPVSASEERERVVPVIKRIVAQCKTPISIDTSKASVARAAIEAGAEIINDVTGLEGDPEMIKVAVDSGAGVCAMHMQGTPQTMQDAPRYEDVVMDIHGYLRQRQQHLLASGVEAEKICLDPGVGFGKTHQHNLELLAQCDRFLDLGAPILIGHSRKGFLGKILGDKSANRDAATLGITLMMAQKGIQIIRVHEVEKTVMALKAFQAVGAIDGTLQQLDN